MRSQLFRSAFIVIFAFTFIGSFSSADAQPEPLSDAETEQVDILLKAVILNQKLEGNPKELTPMLIRMIELKQSAEPEVLILALQRLKSNSESVIQILCKQLADSRHSVRAAAANALVSIGTNAEKSLEQATHSASGRARAAALDALGRMKTFATGDLEPFAQDTDARVRAVVARLLAKSDKPGVAVLASLLKDEEVAVACEAAKSLGRNQHDPDMAIRALTDAMERPTLGWAAANALKHYGTDARRAIPAILKSYPLGPYDSGLFSGDAAEETLKHLGPPDPADIPALCELLRDNDEERLILLAKTIGLGGRAAQSALPALKNAAVATIARAIEMTRKSHENDEDDSSGRLFLAAQEIALATWHITHDADLYVSWIENEEIGVHHESLLPWTDVETPLSEDHLRLLKRLLKSSSEYYRREALRAIETRRSDGESLKELVVKQLHDLDESNVKLAVDALAAIGEPVSDEVGEMITKLFEEKRITIYEFGLAAEKLKFRNTSSQKALLEGLNSGYGPNARVCALALCSTTADPNATALLIINRVGKSSRDSFSIGTAIDVLKELPAAAEIVVPYFIDLVSSNDHSTRHDALRGLGCLGKSALRATIAIKKRLTDESADVRFQAAMAIYQIRDDSGPLESELKSCLSGSDEKTRWLGFVAIMELGPAGAPYLHFVTDEMSNTYPDIPAYLFKTLVSIGNQEAIAVLDRYTESKDWKCRSNAKAARLLVRDASIRKGN